MRQRAMREVSDDALLRHAVGKGLNYVLINV